MINEGYLENASGEKFRIRENIPDGAVAAVICVHGYAEHIGRYLHVEDFLVSNGISFHMMENRGHGMSVGRKGHIDRYDQFIDDLHLFRKKVQENICGLPLFIVAHSNGSLISARYVLTHADGIKGMVLSGIPIRTSVKVNPLKLKTGIFLSNYFPTLSLPTELDPHTLCHDKDVVAEYIKDPLVHKIMSIGFAREFFNAMDNTLKRASAFKTPVLFLHGGDDRACSPEAAREFYEKIISSDKKLLMYENAWHELFNEPDKDSTLETTTRWILERVK